jgi:hypothetical protein
LKNPSGLACLLTSWGMGAIYSIAAYFGLVETASVWLVIQYCVIVGLVLFIAMPVILKLFK